MEIANLSWTLKTLFDNKDKITKPKFQRDKSWTILNEKPEKPNRPNYKEYIEFLIKNKNSVFPISLGTEIKNNNELYIVIDGNNRINAIIHFLRKPFDIFTEYYKLLFQIIDNSILELERKQKIKLFISNIEYKIISSFRRLDNILPKDENFELPVELFRDIESELIQIQNKYLFSDALPFDKNIKLNINIFKNGNFEEYSKIFEDINKHSNVLSENELLSAILYNTTILIDDKELKHNIFNKIEEFYNSRGSNEELQQYKFENQLSMEMNAFDFIIGFQNYCHDKYPVIHIFDSAGLSLFFKIFRILYGDITPILFTKANIEDFINKLLFASNIMDKAYSSIFPKNINEIIFNSSYHKGDNKFIKKNNMLLLITSIIANKDKINEIKLINKNRACIIYHLLCNKKYLGDDEEIIQFKNENSIVYIAGESYIRKNCNDIIHNGENNKIYKLDKVKFKQLLDKCISTQINNKLFIDKPLKRRKLNLLDKILLANYWNLHIPNKYLNETYSLEHISPFSSIWNGNIDIDRLGNLFPTIETINCNRKNCNLDIYKTAENKTFYESIKNLLPENYNDINKFDKNKTTIILPDEYNKYCAKNESIYIISLINDIFSD
jgi:hypothetical protein